MAGLQLVARYYDRQEALIAKSALDGAGFACFLHGDFYVAMDWQMTVALSCSILVPEEEMADAVTLLRDLLAAPIEDGEVLRTIDDPITVSYSVICGFGFLLLMGVLVPLRFYRWIER